MGYICGVKKGNLFNESYATFIVNASNTTLILGSGVSASFKEKCGQQLQVEMNAKFQMLEQKLHKGDVIATSSAEAKNFKYALHAAVMDYNRGVRGFDKLPTLEDIRRILENIEYYLKWYADNNKKPIKLVLPLLGCGVGGLCKEEVIKIYRKFFLRKVSFQCNIVIYGYGIDDYLLLKRYFNCAEEE